MKDFEACYRIPADRDRRAFQELMQGPGFAGALEAFLQEWLYRQSQASNPGLSF